MAMHDDVIAAYLKCRPCPDRLEIGPDTLYELIGGPHGWRSYERAQETDKPDKYANVPIRVRPMLKGWRVVPARPNTVDTRANAVVVDRFGRRARLHDPIASADFDETEALRYEAAQERRKR